MSRQPRVYVLIISNNQFLLVKNWYGSGIWSLPGGGLKRHETAEMAAVREIREEVGINLEQSDLKLLAINEHRRQKGLKKFTLYLVKLPNKPELKIRNIEITDIKWTLIQEIKNNDTKANVSFEVIAALSELSSA